MTAVTGNVQVVHLSVQHDAHHHQTYATAAFMWCWPQAGSTTRPAIIRQAPAGMTAMQKQAGKINRRMQRDDAAKAGSVKSVCPLQHNSTNHNLNWSRKQRSASCHRRHGHNHSQHGCKKPRSAAKRRAALQKACEIGARWRLTSQQRR